MWPNVQFFLSSAEISSRSDGVGFKHERAHVMVDTTSFVPPQPASRSVWILSINYVERSTEWHEESHSWKNG